MTNVELSLKFSFLDFLCVLFSLKLSIWICFIRSSGEFRLSVTFSGLAYDLSGDVMVATRAAVSILVYILFFLGMVVGWL